MPRPSRDETLMEVAHSFSRRSTCDRLHVGAVFSRGGRILVTGYNGAPAGLPHCNHECNCEADRLSELDVEHYLRCASLAACTEAEHAERNAIAFAARHGVALENAELHVTHMPCLPCAMAITNAGVRRVVFEKPYRMLDGVQLLRAAGVIVDRRIADEVE